MPTLILTPRQTPDAQALWRAAVQLGWDVERLHNWQVPEELRTAPEPVLYLEGLMAPVLAGAFGLKLLEPPNDWLPNLPFEYRKREVKLSTLGEARQSGTPLFVKPPNDKSFPASVYKGGELPAEFPDSMPVLISEVVKWEREFRCFILDRQVGALSVYLRNGELQRGNDFAQTDEELAEVTMFVTKVLSDQRVELPRAAVLDVGVIADKGWAVVEQNAAWGAGLYGCNAIEVLEVLRHASVKS